MNEQLLIRYLSHTCTSKELIEVENWMKEDKSHADYIFEAEYFWNLKHQIYYSNKIVLDSAFSTLNKNISKPIIVRDNKRMIRHIWRSAVAVAIIIVLLVMNLVNYISDISHKNVITQNWNTIIVPKGQQSLLILSDDTKVTINAGSVFRYPSEFNSTERTVELKGEALFEVNHDSAHPFVVITNKLTCKDLGTTFNLRAYPSEKIEVTLIEGKIQVESKDKANKITMRPNEQVTYSDDMGMVLKELKDAKQNSIWTKGGGMYNNVSLAAICADLERRFNVNITIKDSSLKNVLFTCHYQDCSSISQIMDLLKYTRKLNYSLNNNNIVITRP